MVHIISKTLFTLFLFMSISTLSTAETITVDIKHPSIGDYTNLQDAHDAASDGDTILVYPSDSTYPGIVITKSVSIIGTGMSYPSNTLKTTKISGTITFNEGSNGSLIDGFAGYFNIAINSENVEIKRNSLDSLTINGPNSVIKLNKIREIITNSDNTLINKNIIERILVKSDNSGTVILQNYIKGSSIRIIEIGDKNDIFIANNIIIQAESGGNYYNHKHGIIASASAISIIIQNNYIYAGFQYSYQYALYLSSSNSYVENNIIDQGKCTGPGYYYNIHTRGDVLNNNNGNIININPNDIFVNASEKDYHLLESSVAKGAGRNGIDIGPYGGKTPFDESIFDTSNLRPPLPTILSIESDSIVANSDQLSLTIKAKSFNE